MLIEQQTEDKMKKVLLLFLLLSGCATQPSNVIKTPVSLLEHCKPLPLFKGTKSHELLVHELELIKLYSKCQNDHSNLIFYIQSVESN